MYLAIMLDRASMGPVIIACSEGGTSIEDLAASHPDKIIKTPIAELMRPFAYMYTSKCAKRIRHFRSFSAAACTSSCP